MRARVFVYVVWRLARAIVGNANNELSNSDRVVQRPDDTCPMWTKTSSSRWDQYNVLPEGIDHPYFSQSVWKSAYHVVITNLMWRNMALRLDSTAWGGVYLSLLLDPIERNVYPTHWPIARAASAFNRAFLTGGHRKKGERPSCQCGRTTRETVDLGYIPSPRHVFAPPGKIATNGTVNPFAFPQTSRGSLWEGRIHSPR